MRKYAMKFMQSTVDCRTGLQSKFCVVQGLQWGQEGKNKLLNKLAPDYDYSCRFNGGKSTEPGKLSKNALNHSHHSLYFRLITRWLTS